MSSASPGLRKPSGRRTSRALRSSGRRFALDSGRYDGFVALGCVIRGDTTHYDYVCGESARGLNQLAIDRKACIGYGILTVENREQAWARARADRANKGADVASACLRMIEIKRQFQQG